MDADAGAAAGIGDHGAGVPEHVEQALGGGGARHGLRGRRDDEARVCGAAAPAQQPRRRAQVGQPAVGARADEHLVDPGALELRGRRRVVDGVRPGHHRDDGAGIQLDDALVGGAGVGGERPPGLLAALAGEKLAGRGVARHEARLGAGLDGHVAEREAAGHGQGVDARPPELERLVRGAVGAEVADEREHQVLGLDAVAQLAGDLDAEGLGDAQPGLAAGHADGDVGAAHAGREGAEGAGHAGVRIGADDEVAGPGVALGDPLVTDAHLDVAERGARGRAEGPDRLLRVGQLAARRRGGVVDEEDAGRRLDGGGAELLELLDGERPGAVLGDGHVDGGHDDLPGHDRVEPGVLGEDLLGERECRHEGAPAVSAAAPFALLPIGTASPRRAR